ncbi:hypothetical protein ACFOGJ_11890 [Marinibaculum pumilum]|uniref:GAF domain-containing protein n=1 Tax=Marinibaculum pumilum TaxID=1766165 RepID=A0ABV7KZU2_9PROT
MILAGLSCRLHDTTHREIRFGAAEPLAPANAVLWSPAGSVAEYRLHFDPHDPYRHSTGRDLPPLLDLAGTEAFLRDERRRRDELLALLDRGGLIVVDLAGDARLRFHTVETIFDIDLALSLPHPGAGQGEALPPAEPHHGMTILSGEPFRSFAAATVAARPERSGLARHPGVPLVRDREGAVLGFHTGIGTGHLVALPLDLAHAGPARMAVLVRHVGRLAASLGDVLHGALPGWIDRFPTAEERALQQEAGRIEDEIRRLRQAQAALAQRRERLRSGRALIHAGGRLLAEAAADAFRSAGAAVLQAREGEGDLVVERPDGLHLVAIAGSRFADPGNALARLAAAAAREGQRAGLPAGAVLLLAGEQDLPPDLRSVPPLPPSLLQQATECGVTLLTTLELFALAQEAGALPGPDAASRWRAWLAAPPRPAGLADWRRYLSGPANQPG